METEGKYFHKLGMWTWFILGISLVLLGFLLLAFNFGLLPKILRPIIFSWEMLLIFGGIISFAKRHMLSGLIPFFVGVFFIIPKIMNAFPDIFGRGGSNFINTYWPVLLIFTGAVILLYYLFKPKHKIDQYRNFHKINKIEDYFEINTVFGSSEYIVLDNEFKGGKLNSIFGNIVLDLRKTNLPEGITYLEVNCVFGGITIFASNEWNIEKRIDAVIFGGFDDCRSSNDSSADTKKLILTGALVFGGGEIKN